MRPSADTSTGDHRWSWIKGALVVYVAVTLQGWLLHRFDLSFNLVLLAVFARAIRGTEASAMFLGAFAGLCLDLSRGGLLGPSMLSMGIVGYWASFARRWFLRVEGLVSLVLVFAFSLMSGIVEAVVFQAFLEYPVSGEWTIWLAMRSLVTAAVWVPGAILWSSESRRYA